MTSVAIRPGAILFRVAAGPRIGFGHLVRCRSLARVLGVEPLIAVRGGGPARMRAATLGAIVIDVDGADGIRALAPSLVVIDDPSHTHAAAWLALARRAGVAVASIHDLGLARIPSDLIIDGSVAPGHRPSGSRWLAGPAYAVLDPSVERARCRPRRPQPRRLLLALGGGRHVLDAAAGLSAAMHGRVPGVELRVARGFAAAPTLPVLEGGRWIEAPNGLAVELAEASVAVLAGGVTLYEACALGVPVVAVAVTAAQRRTIRALARHGAVLDGGRWPLGNRGCRRVAALAAHLMSDREAAGRLARTARRLVDGRGARRVAAQLLALAADRRGRGGRHAA